jgi:hypothetical protein
VDVLVFIKDTKPTLRELSLQKVSLVSSGTLRSIFDYCTCEIAGLESLYFDDSFETRSTPHGIVERLIYFEGGPGKPKFMRFGYPCSNTVDRSGPQIRQPISYFFSVLCLQVDPRGGLRFPCGCGAVIRSMARHICERAVAQVNRYWS